MKKNLSLLLVLALSIFLISLFSACGDGASVNSSTDHTELNDGVIGNTTEDDPVDNSTKNENASSVEILASPDKYTHYIKNYAGKNCAILGYTSLGGDRLDKYGEGLLELIFVTTDGTYVDFSSKDILKEYSVVSQNIKPNTELKLVFDKDSEGVEYDHLVDWQNIEQIELYVKKISN